MPKPNTSDTGIYGPTADQTPDKLLKKGGGAGGGMKPRGNNPAAQSRTLGGAGIITTKNARTAGTAYVAAADLGLRTG